MRVEAIGSIGAALGSVSSGIGRGAVAVGRGAAIFGAKLEAPLATIVRESPVRIPLAGFKPMGVGDIGMPGLGGVFKPLEKPLIRSLRTKHSTIVDRFGIVKPINPVWINPQPRMVTVIQAASQPRTIQSWGQPKAENQAVSIKPASKKQEEEWETEKVVGQELQEELKEEQIVTRKKFVVDQPVLATVLNEVEEATEKAIQEAKELGLGPKILGDRVARLVPSQHEGNTGGAVKPHGSDGTISARKKIIAAKQGSIQTPVTVEPEFRSKTESTLEDLGLADVFQRAA